MKTPKEDFINHRISTIGNPSDKFGGDSYNLTCKIYPDCAKVTEWYSRNSFHCEMENTTTYYKNGVVKYRDHNDGSTKTLGKHSFII